MVDTTVNDSVASVGEQLQVMKLFDRSQTMILPHLRNEVGAMTKLVGKRNYATVDIITIQSMQEDTLIQDSEG